MLKIKRCLADHKPEKLSVSSLTATITLSYVLQNYFYRIQTTITEKEGTYSDKQQLSEEEEEGWRVFALSEEASVWSVDMSQGINFYLKQDSSGLSFSVSKFPPLKVAMSLFPVLHVMSFYFYLHVVFRDLWPYNHLSLS